MMQMGSAPRGHVPLSGLVCFVAGCFHVFGHPSNTYRDVIMISHFSIDRLGLVKCDLTERERERERDDDDDDDDGWVCSPFRQKQSTHPPAPLMTTSSSQK